MLSERGRLARIKAHGAATLRTLRSLKTLRTLATRPQNKKNLSIKKIEISVWEEKKMARSTGLEPVASGVTGRRYNRLNYDRTSIVKEW